tara:strand:- start:222 stop:575 length:354 start_codon:yes stop_codon:yes gene_type:complete
MLAVIRIRGQVGLKKEIAETLYRLKLRKKLVCVLIDEKDKVKMGMVEKVKDFVAYGDVDDKMIKELNTKRGKDKEKGFYRLHPPIGGFKKSTKLSAVSGRGILGKHEDISKLLGRML